MYIVMGVQNILLISVHGQNTPTALIGDKTKLK